jgi:plasmid segregation protein ParM
VRAVDVGFGTTKYVKSSRDGKVECSHFASIAFDSAHERSGDALGGARRTVCLPVGGLWYEVGPDVELAADRFVGRNHHDNFVRTAEYRALVAGALHFMRVDRVDLLVLGLPVAQFMSRRVELARAMTGTFDLGRKRTVEVRNVLVVAQPQGALYATLGGADGAGNKDGRSLVIDAGSRTFDWLVTRNNRVIGKMSHSVNRGVHDMLLKIASAIAGEVGEDFRNLEAVDKALREKRPLRAYQRSFDLKGYDGMVQRIADQAVAEVQMHIGLTDDLEKIVLVGGGAHLFRAAIRRQFAAIKLTEVAEPLYANVRGFQLMGEQYAKEKPELFAEAARHPARAADAQAQPTVAEPGGG